MKAPASRALLGLLTGLDVVVNCQVAPVNAVLGELRRRGVKILDHVHVLDKTRSGRAAGHPYVALAFEHIYDLILTCSEQMVDWFHGMGVPNAKLMHIRNAPSYEHAGVRSAHHPAPTPAARHAGAAEDLSSSAAWIRRRASSACTPPRSSSSGASCRSISA